MPTPPKRKPDSARRANRIIQQRTLLLLALLGIGTFLLLFAQLYKLQIKQHDELKTLAVRQQTLRTTVEASRGTIYDKNGDILALSSTAENVCVSPLDVAKNEQDQDLIANGLGEILGVDPGGILDDMKDTASQYKVIKKKVEQETADKVRVFISDNGIKGVFLEPTSKRYYPYSSLAAHVIGFVNANGGAYGLEAVYDEELTGEKGMVVSARDANGNALLYQYEQYYDAENGKSLVLTLDSNVQYYLEKGIEFSAGSLSLGLSFSVGVALACQRAGFNNRIYVILGDGECNEGLIWESLMAISHYNLTNLTLIVDSNGLQLDGYTHEVMNMFSLEKKFNSFGLDTYVLDGHDCEVLLKKLTQRASRSEVIIAKTIKGKGIATLENNKLSHHCVLTREQYEETLKTLI